MDEFCNNFFSILAAEKHFSVRAAMKVKGWDDGCLFTGGAAASGTHQQQLAAPPQPSAVLKPIIAKLRGSCQTNTPHTKACKDSGPILELLTQEFHWSGIWVHTQHQENSAAASIKALALTECLPKVSLLEHHLRTSPRPPTPREDPGGSHHSPRLCCSTKICLLLPRKPS